MISRRKFAKLTAASTLSASLPLLAQVNLIASASAAVTEKVPIDDPAAIALKYVEDANTASRTAKMGVPGSEQICGNCRFYVEGETPAWGGCALFQSRLVAEKGWCLGWVPVA